MKKSLLKILKTFLTVIIVITGTPVFYFLVSVLLSCIPVNQGGMAHQPDDQTIYLLSNGVHLDILVPLVSPAKDWRKDLGIPTKIADQISLVAFGWGDRDFYLKTPEWSDLRCKTAFNALFLKDSSVLHITYFTAISESRRCKKLFVPEENFEMLIASLEDSFLRSAKGCPILIGNTGYTLHDQFYEAKRSYSLFYTCNTWSNQVLKKCGLRACLWTPFDRGILWQYRSY